jgi:hypothetical protein
MTKIFNLNSRGLPSCSIDLVGDGGGKRGAGVDEFFRSIIYMNQIKSHQYHHIYTSLVSA